MSRTGWIVPTSLLARPIDTRAVPGVIASGSAWASRSTGAITTRRPSAWSRRAAPSTAWCSAAQVRITPEPGRRRAAPNNARLIASVPEDVKVISVRSALSAWAVRSRAWSRAARAARPSACRLDGLPSGTLRRATATSGRMGAPPASSRKIRFICGPGARSAPAVVGLVDELLERALEVLHVEMQVEDLVHADGFARQRQLLFDRRLDGLDVFDRSAGDGEHHYESHLALRAGDLEVKPLLLVTEDLDVTAFQAAPAHRTVVEAGPVADELDNAHQHAHITPHVLAAIGASAYLRCRYNPRRRQSPSRLFRPAAPSGRPGSARAAFPPARARM